MKLRFAPSPTGALHIGGARTALYNWLAARGQGGALVLRIEDTDRERSTPENVEQILDALRWLQIDWDEGPVFQSQRAERHHEVLEQLLEAGTAYRSTATADDVKAFKARHGDERGFRGEAAAEGAVRLHVPDEGETVVRDLIRGETRFGHVHLDDPVIARADGSVLYNFAVAVDDLDAEITHVVRGEDHLSNTPKQLLVYEALGATAPAFAHLPLLHGPDGKKLSKRHVPASVQELRDAGGLLAAGRLPVRRAQRRRRQGAREVAGRRPPQRAGAGPRGARAPRAVRRRAHRGGPTRGRRGRPRAQAQGRLPAHPRGAG